MSRRRSRRSPQDLSVALTESSRVEGTLGELVSHLEQRIALHQEKEDFHARQILRHENERDRHAAERQRLSEHRDSLGKSLAATRDLLTRSTPALLGPFEDYGPASRPKMAKMVARVLENHDPAQLITPTLLAQTLGEIFQEHLRGPVDPKHVSVVLRRFVREGKVSLARKGTSHTEAVYRRG